MPRSEIPRQRKTKIRKQKYTLKAMTRYQKAYYLGSPHEKLESTLLPDEINFKGKNFVPRKVNLNWDT